MGAHRFYRYWLLAAILVVIIAFPGGIQIVKASSAAAGAEMSQIQQEFPYKAFLPCILNKACFPTFFDGFSYPDSGWQAYELFNPHIVVDYVNGEYQIDISLSQSDSGIFFATGINQLVRASEYKIMASVWISQAPTPLEGYFPQYGLVFDRDELGNNFFAFVVVTNGQWYLWKYDYINNPADPWSWIADSGGYSDSHINQGTALNRLGVERIGSFVNLYVNGYKLNAGPIYASNGVVDGYFGVYAENSSPGVSRSYYFDDFGLFPVTCDWAAIFNGTYTPTIPTLLQAMPALTPSFGRIEAGSR